MTALGRSIIIRCGHNGSGDLMVYVAPFQGKEPSPDELDEIGKQLQADLLKRGFNDSLYEAQRFVRDPQFPRVAVTVLKGIEMSKKDYIAIAAELRIERNHLSESEKTVFDLAVDTICRAFKKDNSAFDKDRFLEAVQKP